MIISMVYGTILSPVLWGGEENFKQLIERDWLRQAGTQTSQDTLTPAEDAAGGCDGVKDGKAGFHTQRQKSPWWQVDLGKVTELNRIAIWNRTEKGAARRARHLVLSLSEDGKRWQEVYRHNGTLFYGFSDNKPLQITLQGKAARFVRLGLPENEYFHLDEVEVYGKENPKENLALYRPATQSSISEWSTPSKHLQGQNFSKAIDRFLKVAEATKGLGEEGEALTRYSQALAELKDQFLKKDPATDLKALYLQIRRLRRNYLFSLPALDFDRILINKRPPSNCRPHMCEQYLGRHSAEGPGLVILENWRGVPTERALTQKRLPRGSILHPDLSYDAKRVVFSFCDHTETLPPGIKMPLHPSDIRCGYKNQQTGARRFLIYEASLDGKELRQITGTASDPMKTWGDRETALIEDLDPCYLPDGRIIFSSTRSQNFGRCHGGVYKPSFQLHRANADGSNIEQISFGELNEWDPTILPDGRILYTRWDYINRHSTWYQSLWTTLPDGTSTAHYYGNYTKNPCVIAEAHAIPGSRKIVSTATAHHFNSAGSIILIDPRKGQEGLAPITRVTPEVKFPETEGWKIEGCYATPYPLSESLFLAAYTPESVRWDSRIYSGSRFSKTAFGIYLVDMAGGRELIYRDPETSCFTPLPVLPREVPPIIPTLLPPRDQAPDRGICYVKNVYECTHPIEKDSIKFLRINKIHTQPTAGFTLRSRAREEPVKGVIGTVPVNSDGSVSFAVPADTPIQLQILDKNKMAVMTMRSVIYLRPGEKIGCIGCHENRSMVISNEQHQKLKIMTPQPIPGPRYSSGMSFMRTVQPVLDRHCISCHGLSGKAPKGINLLADKAYGSLTRSQKRVRIAISNQETASSVPKDYFAHAGTLMPMLLKGHHGVVLSNESLERIVSWLDVNAPQYGDYSFNRIENRKSNPQGEKTLRAYIRERFGEPLSNQPYAALVNVGQPDESRILMAPLASKAGGWGEIKEGGWTSKLDPSYRKMAALVQSSITPLKYHDIKGTCGRDEHCVCKGCWVRKLREAREAKGSKK